MSTDLTADDMSKIREVTAECGGRARVVKEFGEVVGIQCYLPKADAKEFRDHLAEIGYRASMRFRTSSANLCYTVSHAAEVVRASVPSSRPREMRSPGAIKDRVDYRIWVDKFFARELGKLGDHEMFRKLRHELVRHVAEMRINAYSQGAKDEAAWLESKRRAR